MKAIAILVEDNPTIRQNLIPAIQELAGMEVVATAEDVDEALAALDRFDWDLVVLDLFLRHGSGLDVLAAVPAQPDKRRIFVLTNYATADIRERCVALGADEVFDKSTELDAFFDRCMDVSAAGHHASAISASRAHRAPQGAHRAAADLAR